MDKLIYVMTEKQLLATGKWVRLEDGILRTQDYELGMIKTPVSIRPCEERFLGKIIKFHGYIGTGYYCFANGDMIAISATLPLETMSELCRILYEV